MTKKKTWLSPGADSLEIAVVELWRSEGYAASTIAGYLHAVRLFRAHCHLRRLNEFAALTRARVIAIATTQAKRGLIGRSEMQAVRAAKTGLRRWAVALESLGFAIPRWRPRVAGRGRAHRHDALFAEYCEFRRRWRSVKRSSLATETASIKRFLAWLPSKRRLSSLTPGIIDEFLTAYGKTVRPKTLASVCCGLRAFLRFLHATGRLRVELARCVIGPRLRRDATPPRALPWDDVRRILKQIDRTTRMGKRDYALFLMMATYAPFAPLTFSGLARRWKQYTAAAGVSFRGTHALRHTHASRQVEAAAPPKVVSDILGHTDPSSLTTYTRVATERLRAVCLPVP